MYREAREDHTRDGITYLRNKPQGPQGPPYFAPATNNGHCTRVSCEYASAIYVCNDNEHSGVRIPLATVADYVEAVLGDADERCNFLDKNYEDSGFSKQVVWGQAFDVNDWLVFVSFSSFSECPCLFFLSLPRLPSLQLVFHLCSAY